MKKKTKVNLEYLMKKINLNNIFTFSYVLYINKPSFPTDDKFKIYFTENSLDFKLELETKITKRK